MKYCMFMSMKLLLWPNVRDLFPWSLNHLNQNLPRQTSAPLNDWGFENQQLEEKDAKLKNMFKSLVCHFSLHTIIYEGFDFQIISKS